MRVANWVSAQCSEVVAGFTPRTRVVRTIRIPLERKLKTAAEDI